MAASATRVRENTPPEVNLRIDQRTEYHIRACAACPELLDCRLGELDREWDIERVLETNASALSLLGLLLGMRSNKWRILPLIIAAFLLQHALQGWCPPLIIFRRMGIRTRQEIAEERAALKALRGDFESAAGAGPEQAADLLRRARQQ